MVNESMCGWVMRPRALILGAAAVVLAAGTATAYAGPTGKPATGTSRAPATAAAVLGNGFERPAAGGTYGRAQWAADGWSAPWDTGLDARTRVDTATKRSGAQSLRVSYPRDRIGPQDSGVSAPFRLPPGREYYLSQWVRFSPDFRWGTTQFAGKVGIGLAGGASCSGGQLCTGYNGFSSRLIWRSNGRAAIYYYSMGHAGQYGDHADLRRNGADVLWPRGRWVNVVQRLRVNTVTAGEANPDGEIQVWVDGVSAASVGGLRFVRNGDLVDRAYLSSFAGGATTEFAPRTDSFIWYDDLKVSPNRADISELD